MSELSTLRIILLEQSHVRSKFDCGNEVLNRYLVQQATQDIRRNLAQIYVMITGDNVVIGYYTINASMIEYTNLPESARKNLPRYPIPASLIGRFAIDKHYQGQGFARKLLGNAISRAVAMSKVIGIHAIIIDAKDKTVAEFYHKLGFILLTDSSLHLYLPIKTAINLIPHSNI